MCSRVVHTCVWCLRGQEYYLLARRWHPDKFSGRPEAEVEAANERFQKIAEAYQVLSDPALREKYDNFGKAGAGGGVSVVDPVTAFSMVFGSGKVRLMRIPTPTPAWPRRGEALVGILRRRRLHSFPTHPPPVPIE